ncbi:hypothetical protein OESDEN_12261 [Oesophagostomum dentatum]|uniref:Uncharacterized protein n=1 Tax=Oesophagostomum dentatum TaxID=61180 RepID=A0A0B1SVM6_OESDE|nr:hypothetical protein OESDEN_12261 [Oesophagostomum dentatum]
MLQRLVALLLFVYVAQAQFDPLEKFIPEVKTINEKLLELYPKPPTPDNPIYPLYAEIKYQDKQFHEHVNKPLKALEDQLVGELLKQLKAANCGTSC